MRTLTRGSTVQRDVGLDLDFLGRSLDHAIAVDDGIRFTAVRHNECQLLHT